MLLASDRLNLPFLGIEFRRQSFEIQALEFKIWNPSSRIQALRFTKTIQVYRMKIGFCMKISIKIRIVFEIVHCLISCLAN